MSHRLSSSHLNLTSQNNEEPTVATIPNIDDSFRVRLDGSMGGGGPINGGSFERSLIDWQIPPAPAKLSGEMFLEEP
ncbi:hypothetical protein E3N88_09912 [Mikania micrantha]|uniref:Uncharacterized protein n=1 Tax=Mikania micrantha TaxID=192012 RepID=A0A5N6P903_9ASTR|nr:hypothetical protein E3N88_09912 [Mikania micrantha]